MGDERALLAAIVAHPEEDTPRLAYADWLQEHGQGDRAEFIRTECELARTPDGTPLWKQLDARAAALWEAHAGEWGGPVPDAVAHYHTRRGFVERIELTVLQFTRNAESIFAHAPLVDDVFLTARGPWTACFARPEWSRVRTLGANDDVITPFGLRRLVACPHLNALHGLNLGFNYLGPDGGSRLARWPHLARLARLDLLDAHVGDRAGIDLVDALGGSGLERLNLSGNDVTDLTARQLAGADLPALAELLLHDNGLTAAGVAALADSPAAANLTALNLHTNPVGDAGGEALLASPYLGKLQRLNVRECGFGEVVIARLRERFGAALEV